MTRKHALYTLLLLLPLLSACDGTGRYLAEQKQYRVVRAYGQAVLDAYAAQPPITTDGHFPCKAVLKQSPPQGVSGCVVYVWQRQAVVEITHTTLPKPDNGHDMDTVTRVGQMRGLASDAEINRFGRAVAQDYKNWVKTPASEAWFKVHRPPDATGWYGGEDCHEFSSLALPVGVQSCSEGPGATDGPTITLQLVDGRYFTFDAYFS